MDDFLQIWDFTTGYSLNFTNTTLQILPDNASCIEEGLSYHIHESWNHNDSAMHIGESDCGSMYTGSHWDPWVASGTQVSCGSTDYNCNTTTFGNDPYSCEIGDLSGKYGKMDINTTDGINYWGNIMINGSSDYEVSGYDTVNKSIVFHCGSSGKRALCAPLISNVAVISSLCGYGQCCSDDGRGGCEYSAAASIDLGSLGAGSFMAQFKSDIDNNTDIPQSSDDFALSCDYLNGECDGDWSAVAAIIGDTVAYNLTCLLNIELCGNPFFMFSVLGGEFKDVVSIQHNSNINQATTQDIDNDMYTCNNGLEVSVYDSWTAPNGINVSFNGSECDEYVGNYHDPTNSCKEDSNTTDNPFCNCTEYRCNPQEYYYGINRFGCSPSDLSGKYGKINVTYNETNPVAFNYTFYDALSIKTNELIGKSLVVTCSDNLTKVACAKFQQYNFTIDIGNSNIVSSTESGTQSSTDNPSSTKSDETDDAQVQSTIRISIATIVLLFVFIMNGI